jgi:hypothetical protein
VRLDHLLSRELFCQLVAFGYCLSDRVFSQVDPTQVVVHPALAGNISSCLSSLVTFQPQTLSAPLSSRPGAPTVGHHSGPSAQAGPLCCASDITSPADGLGGRPHRLASLAPGRVSETTWISRVGACGRRVWPCRANPRGHSGRSGRRHGCLAQPRHAGSAVARLAKLQPIRSATLTSVPR